MDSFHGPVFSILLVLLFSLEVPHHRSLRWLDARTYAGLVADDHDVGGDAP